MEIDTYCCGIGHRYRSGRPVLTDIGLELVPGVTGLVGGAGVGKSTLLRILAGTLRPTWGTVRVHDADLYGRGRRRVLQSLALMPAELPLPGEVRVRDGLRHCGWLRGLSPTRAVRRTEEVLAVVGLADQGADRLRTVNRGTLRRVALAQALLTEPDTLLLDEPTRGLDPEQRLAVRTLIAEYAVGRTVLVSGRRVADLENLAQQVVVLDAGSVSYAGPIEEFPGSAQEAALPAEGTR